MNQLGNYLKKDGWLLAAMVICGLLCLLLAASGSGDGTLTEEERISRVLSAISGAGSVQVAIYYEDSVPCGAVAVAQGAESIAVRLTLTDAMARLLGVDTQRIAVYASEGGDP